MAEPEDEVERIIETTIRRRFRGDPAPLRRLILESLWEAGYEVTRRADRIPIRGNPGEDRAAG